MGINFDTSDLDKLADDLRDADRNARKEARKVVVKAALNIKKDAARRISGHPHLPHYPRAISYDVSDTPDGFEAEIGPTKERRQGPLGHLLEYGGPNNAPMPHLGPALDAEAPKLAAHLETVVAKALGL